MEMESLMSGMMEQTSEMILANFTTGLGGGEFAGGEIPTSQINWDLLNGNEWAYLLKIHPRLFKYCDWDKIDPFTHIDLFVERPALARYAKWEKVLDRHWGTIMGYADSSPHLIEIALNYYKDAYHYLLDPTEEQTILYEMLWCL